MTRPIFAAVGGTNAYKPVAFAVLFDPTTVTPQPLRLFAAVLR